MNRGGEESLAAVNAAQAALEGLIRPFAPRGFVPECDVVEPQAIPEPARALLVNHNHMTVELERHHGGAVEVHVQQEQLQGDVYTRKVGLTIAGVGRVVEWGIARLDLHFLSARVRADILAKAAPLGAILIRHHVHRRVEPRHYVRFAPGSRVIDLFGAGYNDGPLYGRLGTIYCDEEPAIHLLEIVVNTRAREKP